MIKLKYKLAILIGVLFSVASFASEPVFKEELKREIKKSFSVSDDILLGVQNKYGDINIATWDRNEVDVLVQIKVKSNGSDKAKTFFDNINIDFSESSSRLGMKTVYPDQESNSWWGSWWSNGNNLKYEVNYTINAPHGISTKLINKYGNVIQESIGGSCDVINKYGDIHLHNIGEDLDLDLGYGKTIIGKVADVKMIVKYSSIKLQGCDNISLDSKYSDFKFGQCGIMKIDSKYDDFEIEEAEEISNVGKYDDFEIGRVGKFKIDTKYTDIRINYLKQTFLFDGKYGTISINNTGPLERVDIETKYTDVEIGVKADFNLNFYGDNTSLKVAKPYDKLQKQKDGNEVRAQAHRGSKSSGADINIDMGYGSFRLLNNRD